MNERGLVSYARIVRYRRPNTLPNTEVVSFFFRRLLGTFFRAFRGEESWELLVPISGTGASPLPILRLLRLGLSMGAAVVEVDRLLRRGLSVDAVAEVDPLVERVRGLSGDAGNAVAFFSTRRRNEAAVVLFMTLSLPDEEVVGDTVFLVFSGIPSAVGFLALLTSLEAVAVVVVVAATVFELSGFFFSTIADDDFGGALVLLIGSGPLEMLDALVSFDFFFCSCHSRSFSRRDDRRRSIESSSFMSVVAVVEVVCPSSSFCFESVVAVVEVEVDVVHPSSSFCFAFTSNDLCS